MCNRFFCKCIRQVFLWRHLVLGCSSFVVLGFKNLAMLRLGTILLVLTLPWVTGTLQAQNEQEPLNVQDDSFRFRKQEERERRKRLENKRWRATPSPYAELEKELPLGKIFKKGRQCFPIKVIRIKGDPFLSGIARRWLVGPLTGKCLGLKEIDYLIRNTTNYYIQQGYITTRVYIPAQNLNNGSLDIKIVPGYIETIKFATGNGYKSEIITAFPALLGKRLNLRQIEQGLEQINRLQSNQARMRLYPGKKAGQSIVVIDKARTKPWKASVNFNDNGSESRGELGLSGSLSLDNLFLLNDYWSFSGQSSLLSLLGQKENSSGSYTISGSIPLGYWTFSYFTTTSTWKQLQAGTVRDFIENRGETQINDFSMERIVYRTKASKLTFSASITFKETEQFSEEHKQEIASFDIRTTKLNAAYSHVIFGGSLTASLGYRFGVLRGGVVDSSISVVDQTLEAGNFDIIEGRLAYYFPFGLLGQRFNLNISFEQQYSKKILHNEELFSLGGLYTVRGFKEQALSGEIGYLMRNEFSWNILGNQPNSALNQLWGNPTVFIAYDFGFAFANTARPDVGTVHGIATGIKSYGAYGNFSLTISRSLIYPARFHPETAIWLSAGFQL